MQHTTDDNKIERLYFCNRSHFDTVRINFESSFGATGIDSGKLDC
jgi:hypothetical protein